jgi:CelD/BcsL family acetyltransferase involved in cellulose biosynthesis
VGRSPSVVPSSRAAADRGSCDLVLPDDALYGEWEALALSTRAAPFLRPGWVRAWMASFAPHRELRVLTVRRCGTLAALLPVVARGGRLTVPANAETPVMEPLAVDEEAAEALARGLLAKARSADLRFLPAGRGDAFVGAAHERGVPWLREHLRDSPYTQVDGDWDAFEKQVLTTSRRQSLRRNSRRLEAQGRVALEVRDGAQDLSQLFSEGFGLEVDGWKGEQGTAVLSRPRTAGFYRSVVEWASSLGLLRLYFLRVDGRPIGFSCNLQSHGVSYALKTAHSTDFRAYGPGMLMTHRLLGEAFADPCLTSVEFLGEDEPYKCEFSTGARQQDRIRFYGGGVAGRAERGLAIAVREARVQARRRLPHEVRQRLVGALPRLSS